MSGVPTISAMTVHNKILKLRVVTEIANIGVGHLSQNVLMGKVNNNQLNVIGNLYNHIIFPSNRVPKLRHHLLIFLITPAPQLRCPPNHTHDKLIGSQQAANLSHLHKVEECPTFCSQQRRVFPR